MSCSRRQAELSPRQIQSWWDTCIHIMHTHSQLQVRQRAIQTCTAIVRTRHYRLHYCIASAGPSPDAVNVCAIRVHGLHRQLPCTQAILR